MNYTDLTAYRKSNPFMDFCGIEAVRAEHDDCEVKMTITATDKNTHGFVHGGLLFTLADCVAGLTARSDGRNYVTQSAHINFIKNLTEGTIPSAEAGPSSSSVSKSKVRMAACLQMEQSICFA
mgnify:CR=1 FL=1